MQQNTQVMSLHANKLIMLNNINFDKRNMRKPRHSTIQVHQLKSLNTNKFVMVSVLADTGTLTQSNLRRWKNFQDAGFGKNDLLFVSITIRAANKIPISILGTFKATVSEMSPKNEVVSCNSIIYVSDWVFFSLT